MTTLLLVRHGSTAWTAERRLQGRTDIALDERGREESLRLRALVERWAPTSLLVSPAARALETADLLRSGELQELAAETDERLLEAGLGEWEGRLPGDLGADYLAWRAGAFVPPGGERPELVAARIAAVLDEASKKAGPVLLVTHGGVIRAALHKLVGLRTAHLSPVAAASLTVVDTDQQGARLRHYNLSAANAA